MITGDNGSFHLIFLFQKMLMFIKCKIKCNSFGNKMKIFKVTCNMWL